jgi:hypothetical protein
MSTKQFLLVLLTAAVASYAGGTFAVRLLPPNPAQKTVSSQEFHLLDGQGVRRASFTVSLTEEPTLILRDREGKRRSVLSFTEGGEVLWSWNSNAADTLKENAHEGSEHFLTSNDWGD